MEWGAFMDRVKRFLLDRYGVDQLNFALLFIAVILSLTATFTSELFFQIVCWVPLAIYAYRAFSKDLIQRYRENAAFIKFLEPTLKFLLIKRGQQKDTSHNYSVCPHCSQIIAAKKEKKEIVCPSCHSKLSL